MHRGDSTANSPLSDTEERFCREYVDCLNATEAYLRLFPKVKRTTAGTSGWKLLRKAEIQARVAALHAELRQRITERTVATRGTRLRIHLRLRLLIFDCRLRGEPRPFLDALWASVDALERETGAIIPYVFHNLGVAIRGFRRSWRSACKRARLVGMIPHDFRPTFSYSQVDPRCNAGTYDRGASANTLDSLQPPRITLPESRLRNIRPDQSPHRRLRVLRVGNWLRGGSPAM